ncbi:beta-mannosidase [Aquibacillus kalidii]|uniref:beta-mannosidase n=1 Tax=Aquibacillus kalidii TaxID=2762597 RepID=UPI001F1D28AF|nr:glycoside hydrolase family 2 protein [Aquibacillus kalidii]
MITKITKGSGDEMEKINLNGLWKMKPSTESKWMDATVPGSVMHDLLSLGLIEDPFYRDNEDQAYDIASKDYIFTRNFHVADEFLKEGNVVLRSEGIDTISEIIINGNTIAKTNNMHRTYEFEIKPYIFSGENELVIKLYSPIQYIKERQVQNPLMGVDHAIEGYPHLRKSHSMFGWDWGPKIPDLGIWRDISILAWSTGRIDDVYINQDHSNNQVKIEVNVQVQKRNLENVQLQVKLTNPQGEVQINNIPSTFGSETITFIVENPELWWPRGYGAQSLYTVEVKTLSNKDSVLDEKMYQIGLRTIEVKHELDQWGKSFEFIVNGHAIFMMGANYIPEDNLLARASESRTEKLIQDCVEANFNMIRVWGGGHYPDDYFYDLCDRYGVVVWQDFMYACSVYELTEDFEENVKQEAIDNIKRIRHHASLGIWCGNNEVEEAMEYWGWPKDPSERRDYIKLFEFILPDLVKQFDPETFYWSSSPSSGGGFGDPRNPDVGDVHYWEVWHGQKPFTDYRNFYFRFCSEFGFQSFPSLKTVKTFTEPEDRNIFSRVMEKHQKNDAANGKILFYLSENFLYPKDFDSLLYTSQLLQAEAIKYGVEHWRRNRGRCMGSLYWQLNDCWPVASWSSIDYYGRWKALHYFTKKFYDPILLSVAEEGKTADLFVTNDTLDAVNCRVEWELRNHSTQILQEGYVDIKVDALSAKSCQKLDFKEVLTDKNILNTYLECTLIIEDETYSSSTVLFTKPKHFDFLNPNLKTDVSEVEDAFIVSVETEAFTKYIELELEEADAKFEDNYFDLSAGNSRKIKVDKASLSMELTREAFEQQLKVRSVYHITN